MMRSALLEFRLACTAAGWVKPAVIAACMVAALGQWAVRPQIAVRTEALRQEAAIRNATRADASVRDPSTERLHAFTNALIPPSERGEALKKLFSEAEKAGISLSQADYQTVDDSGNGYSKLQIALPLKGPYPKIRTFVESLLVALPSLSVDDISFRRENIKSGAVETRIRMTLHLRGTEQR